MGDRDHGQYPFSLLLRVQSCATKDVMYQRHQFRQTVLLPFREQCHRLCLWLWLWFLGYPRGSHVSLPVQCGRLDHCPLLPPGLRRRLRNALRDYDCSETRAPSRKPDTNRPFRWLPSCFLGNKGSFCIYQSMYMFLMLPLLA